MQECGPVAHPKSRHDRRREANVQESLDRSAGTRACGLRRHPRARPPDRRIGAWAHLSRPGPGPGHRRTGRGAGHRRHTHPRPQGPARPPRAGRSASSARRSRSVSRPSSAPPRSWSRPRSQASWRSAILPARVTRRSATASPRTAARPTWSRPTPRAELRLRPGRRGPTIDALSSGTVPEPIIAEVVWRHRRRGGIGTPPGERVRALA